MGSINSKDIVERRNVHDMPERDNSTRPKISYPIPTEIPSLVHAMPEHRDVPNRPSHRATHISFAPPPTRPKISHPIPTNVPSHVFLSPLLQRRFLHHASKSAPLPHIRRSPFPNPTPLDIDIAETSSRVGYLTVPNSAGFTPPPRLNPALFPQFPLTPITDEWPPCPVSHPHLHGTHRPYMYRNQRPHQRELRMLREFEVESVWERGNPPPQVWDALWRILAGEEEEMDQDIVFGYRYWHCGWYRSMCLATENRERMVLRDAMRCDGLEGCERGDEDGDESKMEVYESEEGTKEDDNVEKEDESDSCYSAVDEESSDGDEDEDEEFLLGDDQLLARVQDGDLWG